MFKAQHIENGYGTLRASVSNLVCKNLHLPFYLKKKTTKQNKKTKTPNRNPFQAWHVVSNLKMINWIFSIIREKTIYRAQKQKVTQKNNTQSPPLFFPHLSSFIFWLINLCGFFLGSHTKTKLCGLS